MRSALRSRWRFGLLALSGVICVAAIALSLGVGSRSIEFHDVLGGLFTTINSENAAVVRQLRLPRTLVGILVGASLSVAGASLQGITRNPIAEPGVLGINAGAALAVVAGAHAFGLLDLTLEVWIALGGATIASLVVYALGTLGATVAIQTRLVLAGAAVAAVASSLTTAILLTDQQTLNAFLPWLVGSLAGRSMPVVAEMAPFMAVGLALAFLLSPALNVLALGDESARSLGLRPIRIRLGSGIAVILLAGSATAGVGPVAFVGLMVPHIARRLSGPDHRWLLAFSVLLGPALLLVADVVGRLVIRPGELQVGIVTAVIGAPALILIARTQNARSEAVNRFETPRANNY